MDSRTTPPHEVRRRDRAKDDPWVRAFLARAATGVLATVRDGQPYLNSNLFVYDPEAHVIYVHTAQAGKTRANVEDHEKVSFTAFEMGRLLPADEALEFSVEYGGVVAFGTGRIVDDTAEEERALQLILDKYAPHLRPGRDYRPITPQELKRTAVFRIEIDRWSGKQKKVEDAFPGAFEYDPSWHGELPLEQEAPAQD
ncbi:MAG: pyridoxamine 5'-phosphate oxidase family protein [Gemmatimonadetes bacterium]|nr:pyridoxamine 5'-phosphate oxidase family protein [Gemmatimonadota bacterium]